MGLPRYADAPDQADPSAEACVARVLLEHCVRRTRRWPIVAGTAVELSITHEQIATVTGRPTAYVCRTLAEFPRRRILGYRWQKLIVLDPAALLAISGLTVQVLALWAASGRG